MGISKTAKNNITYIFMTAAILVAVNFVGHHNAAQDEAQNTVRDTQRGADEAEHEPQSAASTLYQ